MSIIDWGDQQVSVSSGTDRDQELLMGILKLDTEDTGFRWVGTLKRFHMKKYYNAR